MQTAGHVEALSIRHLAAVDYASGYDVVGLATKWRRPTSTPPAPQAIILPFFVDNESENGYRSRESE